MYYQLLIAMTVLLATVAGRAHAQIERGDFVLSVGSTLLDFQRATYKEGRLEQTDTSFGFGPGGTAIGGTLPGYFGLGFGYVAHRHLVTELVFAWGSVRGKTASKEYGEPETEKYLPRREFLARPTLEVPVNPKSRVVLSLQAAMDIRYSYDSFVEEPWAVKVTRREVALGPAFGIGSHFFVVDDASLDLMALITYDKLRERVTEDGVTSQNDPHYRVFNLGLTLGISIWP